MKKILIITSITIICLLAIYIYLTTTDGMYFGRMHHRYNKVITEPLARMGVANAQYKMGEFCFIGSDYDFLGYINDKEEFDMAIYWWEKAAAKGNDKAIKALAYAKTLEESNKEE